jgi:hypothetical protein
VIETGRYRENVCAKGDLAALQRRFWAQVEACELQVLDGPGKLARWGVPEGLRDENQGGGTIHDDLLLSAALVGVLDGLEWGVSGEVVVIRREDPLAEMGEGF